MNNLDEQLDEILAKVSGESFDTAINNPNDYMLVLNAIEFRAKQQLKSLIEERERETMEKFGIKKGVEYKVYGSDKVNVLEAPQKGEL